MQSNTMDIPSEDGYNTASAVVLSRYKAFACEVIERALDDVRRGCGEVQEDAAAWFLDPRRSAFWLQLVKLDYEAVISQLRREGVL